MDLKLLRVDIKYEHDVVLSRQRARQIAELLGFDGQDQVRIATAVSELARNAFQYAGGGLVEFSLNAAEQRLYIMVSDQGRGIAELDTVLSGSYQSQTGMGLGIMGARRLMDQFDIRSDAAGTVIALGKRLPKKTAAITPQKIADISEKLAIQSVYSPFQEMQKQNQELLAALDEVQKQRAILSELNRELEETNRGVVALYAELDERADFLKRASDRKTQFLSNMTHEFRTPLNSIISISQMLIDRLDGALTDEQEKQVQFIQSGAKSLSELVNDLLDLAKVEAGKIVIRSDMFEVKAMFGVLRGMLKPLVNSNLAVSLVFEEPDTLPMLQSDEGKVSQILRNFISNGLKYTKAGEVRVSARLQDDEAIIFSVSDTGMGIADKDKSRIFKEFTQIEGQHQHKVKGTGLGLPLSKRLAELLGGYVDVKSTLGKGSIFTFVLPLQYTGPNEAFYGTAQDTTEDHFLHRVLVIDDNPADRYVLKKLLTSDSIAIVEASSGTEGLTIAENIRPSLIVLDLSLPDTGGAEVLRQLKQQPGTQHIPVILYSSGDVSNLEEQALHWQADAVIAKGNDTKQLVEDTVRDLLMPGSFRAKRQRSVNHA